MEINAKLQRARVERGIALSQISNATKISIHVLQRIEAGRFDELPGGLLTRGYLRAYASEVGLDPEEIVREYRAEFEQASPEDEPFILPKSYAESEGRTPGTGMVLIIVLAVMYFAFFRTSQTTIETDMAPDSAAIDVNATPSIEHAVAPASAAQLGSASPAEAASSEGLQIELRPQADCWVSATADGRVVIYRLMHDGERETIDAVEEILLRVGDAAALTYAVNGHAGRSLGGSGEPVTIHITRDNAATWLTEEPANPAGDTLRTVAGNHVSTG